MSIYGPAGVPPRTADHLSPIPDELKLFARIEGLVGEEAALLASRRKERRRAWRGASRSSLSAAQLRDGGNHHAGLIAALSAAIVDGVPPLSASHATGGPSSCGDDDVVRGPFTRAPASRMRDLLHGLRRDYRPYAKEDQVDADQQPDRPAGRAGQPRGNEEAQDDRQRAGQGA